MKPTDSDRALLFLDAVDGVGDDLIRRASDRGEDPRGRVPGLRKWLTAVAALVIAVGLSLGELVIANAEEYAAAVSFFAEYGVVTEGFSRSEIVTAYRDITTKSFRSGATDALLNSALSANRVDGYEIMQIFSKGGTNGEALWDLWIKERSRKAQEEVYPGRIYRLEHGTADTGGYTNTLVVCIEDGADLWSLLIPRVYLSKTIPLSDGVLLYGNCSTISSMEQPRLFIARLDSDGEFLWQITPDHGMSYEHAGFVLANDDGTFLSIASGRKQGRSVPETSLCVSSFDSDGRELSFRATDFQEIFYLRGAVRFRDGFLIQMQTSEESTIREITADGTVCSAFSYSEDGSCYRITGMTVHGENFFLSCLVTPETDESIYGNSMTGLWDQLRSAQDSEHRIPDETTTALTRDYVRAVLLMIDPETGTPLTYCNIPGAWSVSTDDGLSVDNSGNLIWRVLHISNVRYSPYTSAYTLVISGSVWEYVFDADGRLISASDSGEPGVAFH